ncbi:MAG: class I SAM-dependent methyltransferase [Chloroflexi bacterium]|nr:class I SAM-dependent methyltransferase [Chloroflexota bacterium]
MPFRQSFDCLWCGRAHRARDELDLAGFAHLCPECLGRAQDNGFLRLRLKTALAERGRAAEPGGSSSVVPSAQLPSAQVPSAQLPSAHPPTAHPPAPMEAPSPGATRTEEQRQLLEYYRARAAEYDDWYLRRGRYSRGPVKDLAWQMDMDAAATWLDGLPLRGEIVELAAGTGWWSPLLAQKGELWAYDALQEPLDRARERLVAHGLRAHLHVRDAWAEPDRQVDGLFTGFWLSHVPREQLDSFLALARRWLRPGGVYGFIDSRADPESGATDGEPPVGDVAVRRLSDGRELRITKVFYEPGELEDALHQAGFKDAAVTSTARFFLLGRATA